MRSRTAFQNVVPEAETDEQQIHKVDVKWLKERERKEERKENSDKPKKMLAYLFEFVSGQAC